MAFAKKYTRRITVEGEGYLWYLRDTSLDFEPKRRVVVLGVGAFLSCRSEGAPPAAS